MATNRYEIIDRTTGRRVDHTDDATKVADLVKANGGGEKVRTIVNPEKLEKSHKG